MGSHEHKDEVCLCCGAGIEAQNTRGPYKSGPYRIVCQKCWKKPFLHFPDKVVGKDGLSYPSFRERNDEDKLRIWKWDLEKHKMQILLVEPDYYTRYPPVGLLKLSTFHKSRGDSVELVRVPERPSTKPDIIYVTSLFTYSWKSVHDAVRYYKTLFPETKLVLGGIYASLLPDHAMLSGADYISVGVSNELDSIVPDYSLIGKWKWDSNIVFSSRGCIRRCGFCAIPILEGKIVAKNGISDLIDKSLKKVVLWDNNILANPNWRNIFTELQELGQEVDFNQGFDARLMTAEAAQRISQLKTKVIRLAFDNSQDKDAITRAVSFLSKSGIRRRKILVYTLFNYIDSPDDFLYRIARLLKEGVAAYPMRYEPLCSLKKNMFVSPKWSPELLNLVQRARRVIGYAGTFPPYGPLVKKLTKAKRFRAAFVLRPSLDEIKHKLDLDREDAALVYAYYAQHDLTTKELSLRKALRTVRSGREIFGFAQIQRDKRGQKRLSGSSDWRG